MTTRSALTPADLKPQILGIDISAHAIALAKDNLVHNIANRILDAGANAQVQFEIANIFDWPHTLSYSSRNCSLVNQRTFDIVVSNPPYITAADYAPGSRTTSSVRRFEPKLALVPEVELKTMYHHLLRIASTVNARLVVLEVGDTAQALDVQPIATSILGNPPTSMCVEIWHDDGSVSNSREEAQQKDAPGRALVLWRGEWA